MVSVRVHAAPCAITTDYFALGERIGAGGSRLSPRVPVTINSDAASRIAAVNARVTSPTGVLIMWDRDAVHRALPY